MENKILEEVIVEEIPEVVTRGLNKGLVGGFVGAGTVVLGGIAYKKVVKPTYKKIKAKIAEKKGQEVSDHEEGFVEEN